MMQNELFEFPEPTAEEIRRYTPEYLYEKYRAFYDRKHTEYEHELASMGRMEQENRNIPEDLLNLAWEVLEMQRYITAKPESNPHQYCLRKSWRGNTSFSRVAEIIREYGYVEWFWKKPYMMLNVGEFKYWTMGWPLDVTVLINRTKIVPCTRADLLKYR
jgi:hypothetical protein